MTQRERLVLVDGNALVHRAFHAIGPLMTSRGELVNATFGFASMLLTSLQMIKPDCVAVAFDMAAPTFRKQQYDAYKAHRPHMPHELATQFPRVRQIVEVLGIPIYETEEFEADDVLGTLSVQAVAQGLDVTIVTGDLDALQLVNDQVTVLINRRGVQDTMQYDPAAVFQRFGFAPLQLPDYKALVGDTSDNIPKVPGIGEKTASDLVARYGDVEGVLSHLDEIKARNAEAILEKAEQVRQSKVLATIRRDAPVTFDRDRCVLAQYDRNQAKALLLELEFRSLVGKLPASEDEPEEIAPVVTSGRQVVAPATLGQASLFPDLDVPLAPAAKPALDASLDYTIVRTEAQFASMLERLQAAPAIAFDVETTAPDEIRSELVGVSLSPASHVGFYIPVGHHPAALVGPDGAADGQLTPERAMTLMRPMLEDAQLPKYAHNAKFDVTVLARYGVQVQGLTFDTMVAAYLLNQRGLGLKDMALRELGVEMTQITDLIGKGNKQISMADVAVDDAGYYACADVDLTYRLVAHLEPQLRAQGLARLNQDIEVPLIGVLSAMELEGVAIDLARLQELSHDLGAKLLALEAEIVTLAGHTFNINSTQQLARVLFEELKLPSSARTKTGFSTSSDVLESLRGRHDIVAKVMEYRELIKLKSTYVDGLPALVNPQDGRVHTSFNQTVVATGRLSSTDPNLQNIPIRSEVGRLIRAAFVPGRAGWLLLAADYSQVELRVLAHLCNDPGLTAAFLADQDIHSATASKVFGVEPLAVTANQRRIAKVINFGILYGMGGQAVARQGEVSRQEGDAFIAQYFATFPDVRRYIDQTKREAAEQGYVTTLTGRRRSMPELQDPRREIRAAGERAAVNAPVQGGAADIIKVAMIRLHQQFQQRQLASRMILQVHDELVFEVPAAELATVAQLVRATMESAMELAVPLRVEVKAGANWAEMRAVG